MTVNPVLAMSLSAENIIGDLRVIVAAIVHSHLMQLVSVALAFIPGAFNMAVALGVMVDYALMNSRHVPTCSCRAGNHGSSVLLHS
jgi:hypothetical protein